MPKLPAYTLRDWSSGQNNSVSNFLLPDNAPRLVLNGFVDEMNGNTYGSIQGRNGYTILGNQIQSGKNILGLYSFTDKSGTPNRVIAVVNDSGDSESRTYYLNGSNVYAEIGTTPTNWTAGRKMRFTTFLDYVFAANGDTIRTWEGTPTTDWGTTNAVSATTGNLIANFYDRVNIAGNTSSPSSIFYSGFPNAGTISWTGSELPVNPDDGDFITALQPVAGLLLIFKNRGLYTWNGTSTQTDKIIDVGAQSQECVVTVENVTYFFGLRKDGYGISEYRGEYPLKISQPIKPWLDGITDVTKVCSWPEEDAAIFFIGDTVVNGVTYSNVALRRCISKGTWTPYSLANGMTVGALRVNGNAQTIIVGDSNGQVHTWTSGNTDNGTAIETRIRTKEMEFGSRFVKKKIKRFAVYSDKPQGAMLNVRIDGKKWLPLQSLKKPFEDVKCNLEGNWFEFEVTHQTGASIEPMNFGGFEYFDADIYRYPQ